jgi:peroxiredoxin
MIELNSLKTFDGQPLSIKNDQLTHLIFQEIWSSYENQGEETRVAALPKAFIESSQQIWIQPGINVTEAQLTEYQGYFPQVAPLVLDRGFSLMRSLGGWDLPLHVILKNGKKVFSGSGDALTELSKEHFSSSIAMKNWLNSSLRADSGVGEKNNAKTSRKKSAKFTIAEAARSHYHKPEKGDKAPLFTAKTMAGNTVSLIGLSYNKPLSLVFVDSLCPMPHFPGCEAKLEMLNELVATDTSREWIGIVSSYYVNEEIAQQFRDKFQLKMPLIFDTDNQIYQSYGVHSSPYQIDINREGTIRSRGANIH